MMGALRQAMRSDPSALAEGLDCWLHKGKGDLAEASAEAAAMTVAELLIRVGDHVSGGKWRG